MTVPILSLLPADSPRLNGEDERHIARLAEVETPLPPILVDRRTRQVIDGMHRLRTASLQGRETVDIIYFDGSETDIFLLAVEQNIAHGLPLSHADRIAAAERIIVSHPHMSDRALGQATGLAARTVAAIRRRSTDEAQQPSTRVGRDGKVRPLDSGRGRQRAAELLAFQPEASLRDVAQVAGISPATVRDVRKRLERGEPPAPQKGSTAGQDADITAAGDSSAEHNSGAQTHAGDSVAPASRSGRRGAPGAAVPNPAAAVKKLLRDPSLRANDQGKELLRLLHASAVGTAQLSDVVPAVPPHCVGIVSRLAQQYAKMWHDFAQELDGRAGLPSGELNFRVARMLVTARHAGHGVPCPACRARRARHDGGVRHHEPVNQLRSVRSSHHRPF